jgi:hypothetical protein
VSASPTDWHAVAVARLTRVLGERAGRETMRKALAAIGVAELATADDLGRLAVDLRGRGGFEAAIGELLSVHVAMYRAPSQERLRQAFNEAEAPAEGAPRRP